MKKLKVPHHTVVNLTSVSNYSPPSTGYFLLFWFRSVSSGLTLLFVTQGYSLGGLGMGVVQLPQTAEAKGQHSRWTNEYLKFKK